MPACPACVFAERFFGFHFGRRQWVGVTITAAGLVVIGLTGGGANDPERASLAALIAVEAESSPPRRIPLRRPPGVLEQLQQLPRHAGGQVHAAAVTVGWQSWIRSCSSSLFRADRRPLL
jgi:drug/metabolite transporter (DMT)-like permease